MSYERKKNNHLSIVNKRKLEMQNDELQKNQEYPDKSHQKYLYLFNNAPVGYLIIDV